MTAALRIAKAIHKPTEASPIALAADYLRFVLHARGEQAFPDMVARLLPPSAFEPVKTRDRAFCRKPVEPTGAAEIVGYEVAERKDYDEYDHDDW